MTLDEEDCACTDTTEPSNVTSLQTDSSTISVPKVPEAYFHYTGKGDTGCAYQEVLPASNCCIPIPRELHEKVPKVVRSSQGPINDRSKALQFESTIPCFCHAHQISAYTLPVKYEKDDKRSQRPFWCWFNWKWPRKEYFDKRDKTYEVKLKENQCPHYAKPFMSCEISEGIPNETKDITPEKKSPEYQDNDINKEKEEKMVEKIDIYYFDHGNSAYYRTTDSPPILATEKCVEKTDQAATKFWAEIFGTLHIGTAFITAFILQFFRFILLGIIRPLTVGILQLFADYFIKPFLSIVFNALIQPVLILLYNIATSLRDLCQPLAEAIGLFLKEIANLCRSIRIIEIRNTCPVSTGST